MLVDVVVEWFTMLKSGFAGVQTVRGMIDALAGVQVANVLTTVGHQQARTAARLLREAREDLPEVDPAEKLTNAIGLLECAYDAYAWVNDARPQTRLFRIARRSKTNDCYRAACQIALIAAAASRARGDHEKSVRRHLDRAERMSALYRGRARDFEDRWVPVEPRSISLAPGSDFAGVGSHLPGGSLTIDRRRVRHALWPEAIAEVIKLIEDCADPGDVADRLHAP